MRKYWIWSGLIVLAALIGLILVAFEQHYAFHGSIYQPPLPAPDFSLNNTNGQSFQLSQHKGQLVLLFFGYTNCPDECPATLAVMKQVFARLGSQSKRVNFVFITVDPQRDNPAQIRTFLAKYDPSFIGLSGSLAELTPVWKAYGVYQELPINSSVTQYQVNHSTQVYLIDPHGQLRLTYTLDNSVDDIYQDIQHIINEG
ncbi:MAG TPA: SCO family protein [Anaerolineaceae bacterium]|nr:SCO family protein [Anaerolineaceae bacterium]